MQPSQVAGRVWLVRHGETEWSRIRKHTSFTDLPLTEEGERDAVEVRDRLQKPTFGQVWCSPRLRAQRTAELAGFPDPMIDPDLVEWDYGDYEGVTTVEMREKIPNWSVWTHPVTGGESAEQITERLDRVIARMHAITDDLLVFSHGHYLRALTARWLGQPVSQGQHYVLDTATVSVLGYDRGIPVLQRWNS